MQRASVTTIDVQRTYLELTSRSALRRSGVPELEVRLARAEGIRNEEYLAIYREVGSAWEWRDRLAWFPDELARYLSSPDVRVFTLRVDDALAGFFELRRDADARVEIMYFGLTEPFIGRKLGGWLLTRACEEAFAMGAERVCLNTCSLDSPHALPNYLARGFIITREETYTQHASAILPAPP